ncbi:MAG: barstar family protein [Burkholderiales bacterium]|nr:barstar family protein [Burkholderiales bacterium]PZN02052.1 MAG: hypothetical protein DIU74_08750 [Pseudomonadota bacterium]
MDYAELLTNPGEAGIFLSPPDAEALDAAADRAGLERWRVDLGAARNKADIMSAFQHALGLADGFGANWDALYDVLADRALETPAGVALTLGGCGALAREDGDDFEQLLEVLDSVAESSYDEDIPFWVFIEGVDADEFDLPVLGEE